MTKFVIGFVGRTGSSFLEGLLDSHPDAMCGSEVFTPGAEYDRSNLTYDDFLAGWGEGYTAAGFKLGEGHIAARGEGLSAALRQQHYKAILLHRENLLDQYISMRLAQMNNVWRSDTGSYKAHSFVADPAHAMGAMAWFERTTAEVKAFLHGVEHFQITYETIHDRLPALQEWLGLTPAPLTSKYDRQRKTSSQRHAIENYDEFAAKLAGTTFEKFLTSQPAES